MRRVPVTLATVGILGSFALAQPAGPHLNPVIDLLAAHKAVFGLATPSAGRGGGNRGGGRAAGAAGATGAATSAAVPATPPPAPKTPLDLAKEALSHPESDYLFNGSMEYGVDRGLAQFTELHDAMVEAGSILTKPTVRLKAPLAVKTPKIAPDPAMAITNISRQLNSGVSIVIFVGVESADEVRQGIAAMRFKSNGGTRPDDIGSAPKYWGLSEQEYRKRADVWPLNPNGELLVWVIVESKPGLAQVREIAQVKGISVILPGAGTLGGVFRKVDADGKPVLDPNTGRGMRDDVAWEGAIQQVLAACKEFNVPCGYPITSDDVEMRVKQGFRMGVIQAQGDAGVQTLALARAVTGRK